MSIKYISDIPVKKLSGTALVRLDLNTHDAWRAKRAKATLELLKENADKIVVMSHYGRPEESVNKEGTVSKKTTKEFSLRQHIGVLSRILNKEIIFLSHWRIKDLKKEIVNAKNGSIFLLENLRFNTGEKKDSAVFAKNLASLGDYYVNEAFAVSHRKASSVSAITKYIPSYGGLGLREEIINLTKAMGKPAKPLVVILGGGKAADKLSMLDSFSKRANAFILGGAPANTMLFLKGENIGKSLRDKDSSTLETLKTFLDDPKVHIPTDWKSEKGRILDIGPNTAKKYASIIKEAKTIIWSGPLGFFEKKKFASGSITVGKAVQSNRGAFSITGGGETVMFLKQYGLDSSFSFISTGGGAMIEFLSGKQLPGIRSLDNSRK